MAALANDCLVDGSWKLGMDALAHGRQYGLGLDALANGPERGKQQGGGTQIHYELLKPLPSECLSP